MSKRAIVRDADRTITTNVRLPAYVWRLLRGLAEQRAAEAGGRPSASAVIAGLVIQAAQQRAKRRAA